jgi:hypothetical protein
MPANSYVIWFLDGGYTYAWGGTPEDALARYLANWQRGIRTVVPAEQYLDALPQHRYLPSPSNAIWPDVEPVPGAPLYGPGAHAGAPPPAPPVEPSLAEQVAVLQSQVQRLVDGGLQVVVRPAGCEAVLETEPTERKLPKFTGIGGQDA